MGATVIAAPFFAGASYPAVSRPLVGLEVGLGLLVIALWASQRDLSLPPGTWALVGLHAWVLLQLVPLPPGLLAFVNPGSFDHYDFAPFRPLTSARPVSVDPEATLRGLAYLAGTSLFYVACHQAFAQSRPRAWFVRALALGGAAMALVRLLHPVTPVARSPLELIAIGGVPSIHPAPGHLAAYLAMLAPLAGGLAAAGFAEARSLVSRRGCAAALLSPGSMAMARWTCVLLVIAVGLLWTQSRGGYFALAAAVAVALWKGGRGAAVITAAAGTAAIGAWLAGTGGLWERGYSERRLSIWMDMAQLVPLFPLGTGWNALRQGYGPYQTFAPPPFGEAHNEYLQVLLELGWPGVVLAGGAVVALFRAARPTTPLGVGLLGALAGAAANAMAHFTLQNPANALLFATLAALATCEGHQRKGRA